MDRPRWIRWMVPLIALLLGATPALAEEPPAETPAWRDAAKVEALLGPACDMVESICGRAFKTRPTVVISDGEQVGKIALANMARVPEAVMSADEREAARQFLSEGAMGIYEAAAHRIHICPDAIETAVRVDEEDVPFTEDMLRLLLVHEATHALDEERPGWPSFFERLESADALMALGAVSEGHAQWVTEQAAKVWKIEPAFAALVHHILGSGVEVEGGPLVEAMVAAVQSAVSFAYVQGHRFFSAVEAARGREGVEAILASPPTSTRLIERPAWFLDPSLAAQEMDLKPLLDGFRPLIADPIWQTQELRLMEGMLKSQAVRLPEELRGEFARGFEDGQILMATPTGEEAQVLVAIMRFATPGDAAFFMGHQRKMVEAAAEQIPAFMLKANETHDGVGAPVPGAVGFHVYRELDVPTGPMAIRVVSFHVGRVAFEVTVVNVPGETAESLASFVRYVTKLLVGPEGVTPEDRPQNRVFRSNQRRITVRVLDDQGQPVPACTISIRHVDAEGRTRRWTSHPCNDGHCEIPESVGSPDLQVRATRPQDADGNAMPLAPSPWIAINMVETDVEIRLQPGRLLEGRVVRKDGGSVSGLRVVVKDVDAGFHSRDDLTLPSTTDDKGAFKIVGAPARLVDLEVMDGDSPLLLTPHRAEAGATDIVIHAPVLGTFQIKVVDEDGQPIPGAQAQARTSWMAGDGTPGDEGARLAHADGDGIIRLEGVDPDRHYELDITAGFGRRQPDRVPLSIERWKPQNQTFVLKAGWTLRGQVVGPDGQGIPARVSRRTETHRTETRSTDKDGRFRLEGNPPGAVKVMALPMDDDHGAPLHRDDGWQTIEQTEDPVSLRILDTIEQMRLRLRVIGPNGEQLHEVHTYRESGFDTREGYLSGTWSSLDQGEGVLDRPEGPVRVTAFRAVDAVGHPLPFGPVTRVVDPDEIGEIVLRMTFGRSQPGQVFSPEDRPLHDVEVRAIPVLGDEDFASDPDIMGAHATTRTDQEGRFRLQGLGPGPYRLHVMAKAPLVPPQPVAFDASERPLRVALQPAVRVRVLDPGGTPILGASFKLIRIHRPSDFEMRYEYLLDGASDAQGHILLRAMEPSDEIRLEIVGPEGTSWMSERIAHWDPTITTIELSQGQRLRGTVRDANGPVARAHVTFLWTTKGGEQRQASVAATDDGSFLSPPIHRVPVLVRARRGIANMVDGRIQDRSNVVEVAPEGPSIELVLAPVPQEIRIYAPGVPPGTEGMLINEEGDHRPVRFDKEGHATIEKVIWPGNTLYVRLPGDRVIHAAGLDPSDDVQTVEILDAVDVRFQVDVPAVPVEVDAVVLDPLGVPLSATPEGKGLFVVKGLPPGSWTIKVTVESEDAWWEGAAQSEDGKTVLVPLKPGDG